MTRTIRASLLGGIFFAGMVAAAPASAQIGACPTLIPPPCLVFDYKKLSDMATKRAQDVAKVRELGNTINQWKGTADTIGKTVGQVKDLSNQKLFSGFGDFGDFSVGSMGSLLPKVPSISGVKNNVSNLVYAGQGASNEEILKSQGYRKTIMRAANVDALALRYTINKQVSDTEAAMGRLSKAMEDSTNLRSDWAVNSQVRNEIVRANALQDYLWQAYLTMKSSTGINLSDVGTAKGGVPASSTTGASPGGNTSADWLKVQRLQALADEAANLKSTLGIAKSGQEVGSLLQYIVNEQTSAQQRKAQAYANLTAAAGRWGRETGRSSTYIMSEINKALTNYDNTWASRRAISPVTNRTLITYYNASGIDYNQMIAGEADPRQFLGTWGDPGKRTQMAALAKGLRNGSLKKYIDGDNGTDTEMDRLITDYNDVRLEIAWQQNSYDQARSSITEMNQTLAGLQASSPTKLDDASVWARIVAIGQEANSIGGELQKSTDTALISAAQVPISQIQVIVNGNIQGLQLPTVDPNTQLSPEIQQQIQNQTYANPKINPPLPDIQPPYN